MVFQELFEDPVIRDLKDRPRIWTCRTITKAELGFPAWQSAEVGQNACCPVGGGCLLLWRDENTERTGLDGAEHSGVCLCTLALSHRRVAQRALRLQVLVALRVGSFPALLGCS